MTLRSRLCRSLHFVPGGKERMLEKSLTLAADALVLDLEDAVTPENKDAARDVVCGWLDSVDFGNKLRTVRINPIDSPWGKADIRALMAATPPDALVVPKVSTVGDVAAIDQLVTDLERQRGSTVGALELILVATETPTGALNLSRLARGPRVAAVSWGAEDLSAALGASRNRDDQGRYLDVFSYCRSMTLLSAVAAGALPIDTVFVDIGDLDGLERESREAAWMGFVGKITIHPNQIDIVNRAFSPTAEELAEAEELLAAFEENEAAGNMAFSFRGQMVDVPHLERARRLIERGRLARAHHE